MPQAKARKLETTPGDSHEHEKIAAKEALDASETKQHNEAFANALTRLSDESFRRIWDNPQDAGYDDL